MSLIKWENPLNGLDFAHRNMRKLFEEFDRNFFNFPQLTTQSAFLPTVDINEDKDNFYIIAELPGLVASDVKLSISEGVVTIRGEKKRESEHQDRSFYRMERSYGEFVRQFSLPEGVKDEDIQANFDNGVLEIKVPKLEPSKLKEREIPIKMGNELFIGNGHTKITNGYEKRAMAASLN